ncbi:MAG: HEAT repeat domain-containing protein [Planctomycetes bacterium]|nr:HEAT repeat domain-containing protein [Planctomycetota bacterium]
MSDPLSATFDLLAATVNQRAVEVLAAALDGGDECIVRLAAAALVRRESARGAVELVRRLDRLDRDIHRLLAENRRSLAPGVNHCLLSGDLGLRARALEFVRLATAWEHLGQVIRLTSSDAPDEAERAVDVFRELIRRLYELQERHRPPLGTPSLEVDRTVKDALEVLTGACRHWDDLARPEELVEAVLSLGRPTSESVRYVLRQSVPACRELAAELMAASTHPGVMRLVVESLSEDYPHPKALRALMLRNDPPFACQLLRSLPERLSAVQQKNLGQLPIVNWLGEESPAPEWLPEELQAAAVRYVQASALSFETKRRFHEDMIRRGGVEGRLSAAEVLASLDVAQARDLVFDALDDEDDQVQAWATSQLRSQGVPQAFSMLIERLDSPLAAVRDAARQELGGFDLERVLGLADHLEPELCRRVGGLLGKIHPGAAAELERELSSPVRQRRLRAARGAVALGLAADVFDSLVAMSRDADPVIRRTAVETLATLDTPEAHWAIAALDDDENLQVRDAARRALAATTSARHASAAEVEIAER